MTPLAGTLDHASDAVETVLAGKPRASSPGASWFPARSRPPSDLRRFIQIHPVLDYSALEPGKKATDFIRKAAADLKLKQKLGASVRLTGTVPIADQEFATVQDGAVRNLHRHHGDRAGHPVAGAALGAHHRRRLRHRRHRASPSRRRSG